MSLFVGNISHKADYYHLNKIFSKFGRCKIDKRERFAFIDYDLESDASQAIK